MVIKSYRLNFFGWTPMPRDAITPISSVLIQRVCYTKGYYMQAGSNPGPHVLAPMSKMLFEYDFWYYDGI